MPSTFLKISSSSKRRLASVLSLVAPLLIVVALLPVISVRAANLDEVRALIATGESQRARQMLLDSPWAGTACDWERLNFQLTPAGDSLVMLAGELLGFDLPAEMRVEIVTSLARQYLATGNYSRGLEVISKWGGKCRNAENYPEVLFTRAQLRYQSGIGRKSIGDLKRVIKMSADAGLRARAALLLGDIHFDQGNHSEAAAYYTRLAQVSEVQLRGLALDRLAKVYASHEQDVEAELVTAKLRSCCPGYASANRLNPASAGGGDQSRQVLLSAAGSMRSVQQFAVRVGSFVEETAAREVHRRFVEEGYTSKLATDIHSGQTVYVVDIGRFSTAARAARFMEKLSRQTKDTYFVVSN